MSRFFSHFLVVAVFSFLGGAASNVLFFQAQSASAGQGSPVSYRSVSDEQNLMGIEAYVNQGWPAQNFYAPDGKIRLQLGMYNAAGEAGLPLTAFSDNDGNLRMLFRLAGANESPVIIMKDRQHRDRVVFGLGLADAGEEPFMAVIDSNGRKKMIFGNF